jgi:exodeoxyribonuclease VII large subunit
VCEHRLEAGIQKILTKSQQAFTRTAHTLDALSPLAVLERGYSVCLAPDGRVIRRADAVELNSTIEVRLHQGRLFANVTSRE